MSISLEDARKKLDILEKLANKPELILTDLFTEGIYSNNFLYQVEVNGKYILDYLKEHLLKSPVFTGCNIENMGCAFRINVAPLRVGEYAKYLSDDTIVKIDAEDRTFKICNTCIDEYDDVINTTYVKEIVKLEGDWVKFQDLTVRKRFSNAFNTFKTNKKLLTKIIDFFLWLSVRKSKVERALKREIDIINRTNKECETSYNDNIEKQNYYLQYSMSHIQMIINKQNEISKYLLSLGYQEDDEMSEY